MSQVTLAAQIDEVGEDWGMAAAFVDGRVTPGEIRPALVQTAMGFYCVVDDRLPTTAITEKNTFWRILGFRLQRDEADYNRRNHKKRKLRDLRNELKKRTGAIKSDRIQLDSKTALRYADEAKELRKEINEIKPIRGLDVEPEARKDFLNAARGRVSVYHRKD